MGIPVSEIGYTIATTRKETTKVHKNRWWQWGKKERKKKKFGKQTGRKKRVASNVPIVAMN